MVKKKAIDITPEIEFTDGVEELMAATIEPYELIPPCQFIVDIKEFDTKKMAGYVWRDGGRFSLGDKEMLVVEVL